MHICSEFLPPHLLSPERLKVLLHSSSLPAKSDSLTHNISCSVYAIRGAANLLFKFEVIVRIDVFFDFGNIRSTSPQFF